MRYQQSSRFMRVGSMRTRKRATTCANTNLNARKLTRTERTLMWAIARLERLHERASERAWVKWKYACLARDGLHVPAKPPS